MAHKDLFKKIATRITQKHTALQNSRIMHPVRDWAIGLIIAVVLFFMSAAWSANEYVTYRDVTVVAQNIDEEVVVYRASMVSAALQEFEQRAILHQSLLTQSAPVVVEAPVESVATSSVVTEDEEYTDAAEAIVEENDGEEVLPILEFE